MRRNIKPYLPYAAQAVLVIGGLMIVYEALTVSDAFGKFGLVSALVGWNLVAAAFIIVGIITLERQRRTDDPDDAWWERYRDVDALPLGRHFRQWFPTIVSLVGVSAGVAVILTVPDGDGIATRAQEASLNVDSIYYIVAEELGTPGPDAGDAARQLVHLHYTVEKAVGILTVVCSWTLLHAGYGLLYGWLYRTSLPDSLSFPGTDEPRDIDFMYHAFTVGSTFAVSDVTITDTHMRWHTLWHSVIGFFYNAIVMAIAFKILTGG